MKYICFHEYLFSKKSRFIFNQYLYNNCGGETMSIGPLSEWVTAFAEIAAVCVALFLPVYDKKQEKHKKTRNMKAIFTFLIKKALEEKDTSNLESYFKISYLIIDSNDDKQIYSLLQHAIEILNNQNMPEDKKRKYWASIRIS